MTRRKLKAVAESVEKVEPKGIGLEECKPLFGVGAPRRLPERIERILRLKFSKVTDAQAAEILQIHPSKVQGMYQRYTALAERMLKGEA